LRRGLTGDIAALNIITGDNVGEIPVESDWFNNYYYKSIETKL
jgi:hypothetical protein